jgi:hypothetical protein
MMTVVTHVLDYFAGSLVKKCPRGSSGHFRFKNRRYDFILLSLKSPPNVAYQLCR